MINGRALHFVLKIGDRKKNLHFFKDILGMKVLRHEEFEEGGCDAKCNGPYDNHWSKTMIGYGSEHTHFIMELIYNYGIKSYELGNEFGGITIRSSEALIRAKKHNYSINKENEWNVLISPDGYKFYIIDEAQPITEDPIHRTTLNSSDLKRSLTYWNKVLNLNILSQSKNRAVFKYAGDPTELALNTIDNPIKRGTSYGRIVFAVPFALQPNIDEKIRNTKNTILTPLLSLDTPGKATVRVLILADPDGHEICFVDNESFTALSEEIPNSEQELIRFISEDPFQL